MGDICLLYTQARAICEASLWGKPVENFGCVVARVQRLRPSGVATDTRLIGGLTLRVSHLAAVLRHDIPGG